MNTYTYKLTQEGAIIRSDGISFPKANGNRHYREYLEWLDAGNVPMPADPLPAPVVDEYSGSLVSELTERELVMIVLKRMGIVDKDDKIK